MKKIELTKGKFAIVDDEDYETIRKNKWYYNNGYARRDKGPYNNRKTIFMHRVIIDAPEGLQVDHINLDKLDNRKQNLRLATSQENSYNMNPYNKTSKYKGVSYDAIHGLWFSSIRANTKSIYIGRFEKETDAANAYNIHAKKFHGKFARLNDVPLNENWKRTKYKKLKGGTSKYFGVSWHKQRNKWRAYIRIDGKRKHIGSYGTEIEAAKAFNEFSKKHFQGEGYINILEE